MARHDPLPFCQLPDAALQRIFLHLSYHKIACLRRVNRKFNSVCNSLLNDGFLAAERYCAKCVRSVKSTLPRRESSRRGHPLLGHCQILGDIETTITLLRMTFMVYVDTNLCSFFPGKVIDHVFSVLRIVQHDKNLQGASQIMVELKDVSYMAIDYFDDRIAHGLKSASSSYFPRSITISSSLCLTPSFRSFPVQPPLRIRLPPPVVHPINIRESCLSNEVLPLTKRNKKLKKKLKICSRKLKRQTISFTVALEEQKEKIENLSHRIDCHNRKIAEQNDRLIDQESEVIKINRKMLKFKRNCQNC